MCPRKYTKLEHDIKFKKNYDQFYHHKSERWFSFLNCFTLFAFFETLVCYLTVWKFQIFVSDFLYSFVSLDIIYHQNENIFLEKKKLKLLSVEFYLC